MRTRATTGLSYLVASVAASAFAGGSAEAQQATDEIVVTGQRLANKRSIEVKRETLGIVDSVNADDVGKLPDFNVGDSLRRVPGVNVSYYQGEPRFITIRGLNANYNTTTIDGFHVASPDPDGRRIFAEVLPSSLASRLNVMKSGRADKDGHAIGGLIDLKSNGVDDLGDDRFRVSGQIGQFLQQEEFGGKTPSSNFEAMGGQRFGEDDQFALLVTASHWQRELYVPQLESGGQSFWYNNNGTRNTTPYGGNGRRVPQERRWYIYDNDRERDGVTSKLEWKPSEAFHTAINAYYFNQHENSDRYETTAQVQANATVSNQTDTSGTLSNVNQLVQLGQFEFERTIKGVNVTSEYKPNDDVVATFKLGRSEATSENPQTWDQFQQNGLRFSYDLNNPIHTFTATSAALANDPARYRMASAAYGHREENQSLDETVTDLQVDLENKMKGDGLGFKAGGSILETNRTVDFERTNYTGNSYSLANILDTNSKLAPYGSTGSDFFAISKDKANKNFANLGNTLTKTKDVAASFNGDYGVIEEIGSLYALSRYQLGGLQASAGLRYERTDIEASGFRLSRGAWTPVQTEQSRDDLLPSAQVAINFNESLRLTTSYARALGRARYSDLAPRGEVLNDTLATPTLSRANPDLQPRMADNYDIAMDWFFDNDEGIVSLGFFRKNIKDEIFTFGQLQTLQINGVDRQVLVTQAQNSEEPVQVNGIELGFVKNLSFLPEPFTGFGISGNYTRLFTDFQVTLADGTVAEAPGLPEQAEMMANLALFYENGPFKARIAYNYTGPQWESRFSNFTNAAEFYRNRYQQSYEIVDLQIRYDVDKNLTLQLEAQNVLNERKQDNIGIDQEIPQAVVGLAPSVYMGASYRW